jgi:uroporphyrinogen decarboxylase
MNSKELVRKTILGENTTGITPIYGWVKENLSQEISEAFGSVRDFEDHYKFDMSHLFGGPKMYDEEQLKQIKEEEGELTPEMLLDIPMLSPDNEEDYASVKKDIEFYGKDRERFCYIQSNGIFELNNAFFGIEDHLCWTALYPEELKELYQRQAKWNIKVANHMIDLGVDMIHISDDWGSQKSLLFNPKFLKEYIIPSHKEMADAVKKRGVFLSLHSDGYIKDALDSIVETGYNVIHPWQESAGMSYDLYLKGYQDKFAILGGLCVQTTLGFNDYDRLKSEIERVFATLKNKRWIFCTTHFVQNHCSIEELTYAYDLALKLTGK